MIISALICTHNRPTEAIKAYEHISSQELVSGQSLDKIIVDDNSSVNKHLLKRYFQSQIDCTLVQHKENRGLPTARNSGIKACKGDWFTFCDDDDLWPPLFLKKMSDALLNAPEDVQMIIGLPEKYKGKSEIFNNRFPTIRELIYAGFTPPISAQMYKVSMIRDVEGYNENIKSGVDHDLWIRLAEKVNPRVAVAWGATAIVGVADHQARLTTNELKRRGGIENSLKLWADSLVITFGADFYKHFVRSYKSYLDFTFFMQQFRKKKYLDAIFRLRKVSLLVFICIYYYNRASKRCNLFPKYK